MSHHVQIGIAMSPIWGCGPVDLLKRAAEIAQQWPLALEEEEEEQV